MRTRKRLLSLMAVLLILCVTLITPVLAVGEDAEAVSRFYNTLWAFLPPVIAIVLALITKEAYSSLFIGIVVGALLHCNFAPVETMDAIINDGLITAIADNAGIFLFLVILGAIVALVNAAGGSAAFGRWAEKNIKTRVGAMLSTFVLGILIFIDDYFNCLTVGSVMRPVTDGHKISRAKLAYLIDATAAPVCMIAPVSSWAAAVSGVAADLDTGVSGIQLFVQAIPFNFYSLLTFVFIVGMALMKLDYGPMRQHELTAQRTGELGALPTEDNSEGNPKGRVMDLILPVVVLIVFCIIGMIYVGGFWGDNAGDFIAAFGDTDAFVSLPWGALIALVLTIVYVVARRLMTFKAAMACIPKGFIAMVPPITILTLAVSLKTMTGYLGAAEFVEAAMKGASQHLYSLLPAVIFVVACFLAFASGTSWGTFGILIPIVTAIFPTGSTLLTVGISACLAGAVCGDHCSPISDTTIMASAGAQCDHVTHVSTQLPYAITVAAVSFVSFIIAGFVPNIFIALPVAVILMIATLFVIRASVNKAA
ncbi:Na+/H+ antiporter NhaC family protein [Vermiculatibacterium agrestimuris]|uniref:Na+/H+ antiporter NhaC family protein n=1 Tax=Vermiculatibacterium agrestimuris TaxID=2941519 RepID=UPI00203E27FC|nr:Na+/H+ antiporter NhaC family protein [Vermiculatibacterium agrestimuris]